MRNKTEFYYSIADTLSSDQVLHDCKADNVIGQNVLNEIYSIIEGKSNIWNLENKKEYVISIRMETNGHTTHIPLRVSFKVEGDTMMLTCKKIIFPPNSK